MCSDCQALLDYLNQLDLANRPRRMPISLYAQCWLVAFRHWERPGLPTKKWLANYTRLPLSTVYRYESEVDALALQMFRHARMSANAA